MLRRSLTDDETQENGDDGAHEMTAQSMYVEYSWPIERRMAL